MSAKIKKERKPYTIHKTDILLNKDKLKEILDEKGMEYMELYIKTRDKFGLSLSYKGFMSLLQNRSTWKLVYAWGIADVLHIAIGDVFEMIKIDFDKAVQEKIEWKEKYQK